MARSVGRLAGREWRAASKASLLEQHHLMSSAVSLAALNPFVWPGFLLASLLKLSKRFTQFPIVRTLLYIAAVCWSHAVILSIRSVAPTCFAYVGLVIASLLLPAWTSWVPLPLPQHGSVLGLVALVYSLVEVGFYFQTVRRAARLQRRVAGPEMGVARRWLTYRRVEASSRFVLPMAMPKTCVHWTKFKAIRWPNGVPGSRSSSAHSASSDGHSASALVPIDRSSVCATVTPSSRYMDSNLRPISFRTHAAAAEVLAPHEGHPLEFLKGWFFNVPLQHVKHDNLMVFFAESQWT